MTGREKPQTPAYMRAQDAVLELVRSEGFAPGPRFLLNVPWPAGLA